MFAAKKGPETDPLFPLGIKGFGAESGELANGLLLPKS